MQTCDPLYLTQLIHHTLVGTTQQIRQAQYKLKQMYNDPQFMPKLMLIPKQKTIPYNLRKAAIIYTLTYAKNNQNLKKQQILQPICKQIFNQLGQDSLEINLRKHLIYTLKYLITYDKSSRIKYLFYQETVKQIQQFTQNLNSTNNNNKIIYIGLAVQTILTLSIHNTKQLQQFIKLSFIKYVNICIKLYQILNNITNINIQQSTRENILAILQVMKVYSHNIKLYIKKILYFKQQTVKILFQPSISILISKIWQYNLPNNSINTNVMYYRSNFDMGILQIFNHIKSNYIQSLGLIMRCVFQHFKDPRVLAQHPLLNNHQIILILIQSIKNLYTQYRCTHYIKSPSIIKLIQQILNTLLIALRSNIYYDIFHKNKQILIQNCIFSILKFNPQQYVKILNDPQQSINQILQIIDMDPTEFLTNRKKQDQIISEQKQIESQDIQSYTTLKTVAATLLNQCCKNIDGVLMDILKYIQNQILVQNVKTKLKINNNNQIIATDDMMEEMLESMIKQKQRQKQAAKKKQKQKTGKLQQKLNKKNHQQRIYPHTYTPSSSNSQSNKPKLNTDNQQSYSNSTILLILGILRDLVYIRKQQYMNIIKILIKKLKCMDLPQQIFNIENDQQYNKENKENNLEFLMLMIVIQKYISKVINGNNSKNVNMGVGSDKIIQQAVKQLHTITYTLLVNQNIQQSIKIVTFDMIIVLILYNPPSMSTGVNPASIFPNTSSITPTPKYSIQYIKLLNNMLLLLAAQQINSININLTRTLDIIYNIYKYKDQQLLTQTQLPLIFQTLTNIHNLLIKQINLKDISDKDIINKCMNIIIDICTNQNYMGIIQVRQCMENGLYQLSMYMVNGEYYRYMEYDDSLLDAVNGIMEVRKDVTQAGGRILSNVCKMYYGKYEYKLGEIFQTLCLYTQYGKHNIQNNPQILNMLIQISMISIDNKKLRQIKNQNMNTNASEDQHQIQICTGCLLIHILIINHYNMFTQEIWNGIIQISVRKLDNLQNMLSGLSGLSGSSMTSTITNINILKNNLLTIIMLCMMYNKQINKVNIQILINKIIYNKNIINIKYCNKIIVICLSQIITSKIHEDYIKNRITNIIQCLLDLIKLMKIVQYDIDKNSMSQLQKKYNILLSYVKHQMIDINQIDYFKQKMISIKMVNPQVIQNVGKQLSEQKLAFFKELMATANVKNQSRMIYKIKR